MGCGGPILAAILMAFYLADKLRSAYGQGPTQSEQRIVTAGLTSSDSGFWRFLRKQFELLQAILAIGGSAGAYSVSSLRSVMLPAEAPHWGSSGIPVKFH